MPLELPGVVFAGTGTHLPDRVVDNAALIAECGLPVSPRWIERHTGIRERRWAAAGETTAGLAIAAGAKALADAGIAGSAIKRVVLATVSGDWPTPATACVVQDALGVQGGAFDLVGACSGFMAALDVGRRYVQTGDGPVLVIGSEIRSRFMDRTDPRVAPLFADGAGAVVLTAAPPGQGLLTTVLVSDGAGAMEVYIPAGGASRPASAATVEAGEHTIRLVDGRGVFQRAVTGTAAIAAQALEAVGMSMSDVDLVIPHQANKLIIEASAKAMEVPMDRVVVTIEAIGNCTAATVPITLDVARRSGRLLPGMIVLLVAVGGGFSAGAAIYRVPT